MMFYGEYPYRSREVGSSAAGEFRGIVPAPDSSSSHDGLPRVCTAGTLGEIASARNPFEGLITGVDAIGNMPMRLIGGGVNSDGMEFEPPSPHMDDEEDAREQPKDWAEGEGSTAWGEPSTSSGKTSGRLARKRRKEQPPTTEEEEEEALEVLDSEEELAILEHKESEPEKRGRGRPPTSGLYTKGRIPSTGQFISRAAALQEMREQEELLAFAREERLLLDPHQELPLSMRERMKRGVELQMEKLDNAPTPDVAARALEAVNTIVQVSRASKGLKGSLQAALRDSAARLQACAMQLAGRAQLPEQSRAEEEVRALREELKVTRDKLAEMETALNDLRKKKPAEKKPPPQRRRIVESEEEEDTGREMGNTSPPPPPSPSPIVEPQEDTAERSKVVLPPREEWPPAIRPALKGQTAIIPESRCPPVLNKPAATNVSAEKIQSCTKVQKQDETKSSPFDMGELQKALMNQMSAMFNGWAKKMEEKFDRAEENKPKTVPPKPPSPPSAQGGQEKRKKKGKVGEVPPPPTKAKAKANSLANPSPLALPTAVETPTPTITPVDSRESWAKVVGRREVQKKKAAEKAASLAKTAGAAPVPKNGKAPAKKGGKVPPPPPNNKQAATTSTSAGGRRKLPRNAAITLTCPAGTYAEIMKEAREKVDLASFGIDGLKPRRARTGALILEVPGQDGAAKAEALATKLSQVLADKEGVRVARPIKKTELRVSGLEDSVSQRDVAEALSQQGGGRPEEISVGEIRKSPNGLGSAWAKLPVAMAKKATAGGKVRVGWALAKVEELPARPTRCYRCLCPGHLSAQCTSETDRGSTCYRCGTPGHLARTCTGKPKCLPCEEAGLKADHIVGAKSCKAPSKRSRRAGTDKPPAPKEKEAKRAPGAKPGKARKVEVTGEGGKAIPRTQASVVSTPSQTPAPAPKSIPMDIEVSQLEGTEDTQPLSQADLTPTEPMEIETSHQAGESAMDNAPQERQLPRVVAFESLATRIVVVNPAEETGPGYL